ncbi:MAG: DUF721 domain-containing protein [Acidobacteria bacterium]|nr:DUF721 domain-containing protein [Acidobacteriota bacterium]
MGNANELESARGTLLRIAGELARNAGEENAPAVVWPLVCGAAVGERTRVLGCNNGILRIAVPDATWRLELVNFAPRYVASLAQLLPAAAIKRVEFVVA